MKTDDRLSGHKVVSHAEWVDARRALLAKEKELTRLHDQLAAKRRELPWERIDREYVFEAPEGRATLADLFQGRSQLAVYHFMFGPDWQEGCPSCSFISDHIDGAVPHLAARDVTLTIVSRAPLTKIEPFRRRMGWQFPWVSSFSNNFNRDFHVSFTESEMAQGKVDYNYTMQEFPSYEALGLSIFYKDPDDTILHTYSTFGRGLDHLIGAYMILDMVPKGRDEDQLGFSTEWLRHHDRYGTDVFADPDRPYWPDIASTLPPAKAACCNGKEVHS